MSQQEADGEKGIAVLLETTRSAFGLAAEALQLIEDRCVELGYDEAQVAVVACILAGVSKSLAAEYATKTKMPDAALEEMIAFGAHMSEEE